MSIISSRSAKSREGFTPYQSDSSDLREISLFSRLNLNDNIDLERPLPHQKASNKSSSDLLSVGSKKRKLSEELMNSSKMGGNKTFLNRSLLGKSSLNGQLLIEMDSSYNHKKELSENSCPVVLNNEEHDDLFSEPESLIEDRPRFTKTKNLLRNISNYMHKFILYNKRAEKLIRHYFQNRMRKSARKLSTQKSVSNLSNKSDAQFIEYNRNEDSNSSPPPLKDEVEVDFKSDRIMDENLQVNGEARLQEQCSADSAAVNEQITEFFSWVGELSIGNFNDYENIWTRPHKFRSLYRIICFKYYKNEAFCDIFRSRLTTKEISTQYLVQFIEGILQPAQFYRFK